MALFKACFARRGVKEDKITRDTYVRRRKMVIVGDGECGKTCLVNRMSTGHFVDSGYVPTVFDTEVVDVRTGQETVELCINDTAGQEDYDRLRPFSYHDVDAVLVCFSLAEPDSLGNVLETWSPEIRYFCGDLPVILVGNKSDLRDRSNNSSSKDTPKSSLGSLGDDNDPRHTPISSLGSLSSKDDAHVGKETSTAVPENDCHEKIATNTRTNENPSKESDTSNSLKTPPFMTNTTSCSQQRPKPVKHSEAALVAKRMGAVAYFETSALTGDNTEELLLATAKATVLGSKKAKKFKPFSETLRMWKSPDKPRRS